MKKVLLVILLSLTGNSIFSQDLLKNQVSQDKLAEILIAGDKYNPIPRATDRKFWDDLSGDIKKMYIGNAEELLNYSWPSLSATATLAFVRTGDRNEYQNLSFPKRTNLGILAIAEAIENKGRFLDQVINGIWSICEESYWGVPAHLNSSRAGAGLPDVEAPWVDLFAAETVNYLAWTDYLIGHKLDSISPLIRKRIRHEANQRIYNPIENYRHAWMDWNFNWNPWICSNWLSSVLLLEDNQVRRVHHVSMVLESLDNFLNPYPADGGCDEGPGYWSAAGSSLFECLEILNLATNGKYQVYDQLKIKNIGSYIYKVQISENRFINFADAHPYIHPQGLWIYRFGMRISDPSLMQFGKHFADDKEFIDGNFHFTRKVLLLTEEKESPQHKESLPLPADVWFPDIQVMLSRDKEGSDEGFCIAAKGGNNAEAHNHNDVGNFIVYYDGEPLIIDAGSGTYTARFFSKERYSLWMTNSAHHNVPLINAEQQPAGKQYQAKLVQYNVKKNESILSLDIAGAYPENCGISQWIRTITHKKGDGIILEEKPRFNETGTFSEIIMTVVKPDISQDGKIILKQEGEAGSGVFILSFDPVIFEASYTKMPLDLPEDEGIKANWKSDIYRIELKSRKNIYKGNFSFRLYKNE